jgi:hypothetical protein
MSMTNLRDDAPLTRRLDLLREGDVILKCARCDAVSGEKKDDKNYRRNKRAERKASKRHWREKQAKLGTSFGAASPARSVEVDE